MDVSRLLVRTDLSRRWRSWLAVVLLIAVIGGASMAAVAGWRRTDSAMERFFDYHDPANAYVEGSFDRADIEAIEGVEAALGGDYFLLTPVDDEGRPHPEHLGQVSPFSVDTPMGFSEVGKPIIVAGRLADPADPAEVMVDEEMAELYDLEAGETLQMQAFGMDQAETLFDGIGTVAPTGTVFDLTVAGIIRSPQDVVPHQSVPEVVYLGSAEVQLGPAFDAAHRGVDVPSLGVLFGDALGPGHTSFELRVDFEKTTPEALTAAVEALDERAFLDLKGGDASRATEEATRSITLQSTLLLALAFVVALGGTVLIVQALRRQLEHDHAVERSLGALGATRQAAVRTAALKSAIIGTVGAVLAVGVAIALSPLTPVGHARRAEVDPGLAADAAVLVPGAVGLALFVVAFSTASAWRASAAHARALRRAGRAGIGLADRARRAGMPPSVVAGVRSASMGTGGMTVLVTVFVAAVGIVGALSFAASEHRLATDPDLWGWTFDAVVGDGNDPAARERADATLGDNPMVEAYATRLGVDSVTLTAGDTSFDTGGSAIQNVKGTIEPRLLDGDAPEGADEIALGGATARKLGVGVGDEVMVDGGAGQRSLTVSGLVVMHLGYDADRIGEGVLLSPEAFDELELESEPVFVLVDYADGVDHDEEYAALQEDWGYTVLRPLRGVDVEQLHNVRHLPFWFSLFLGVVAAATLTFVLVMTIRRRRRDLALLRTLGFERRQLRSTVFVQSLTLVVPGAALGILGGLVVGRLAWGAMAQGMGAPEEQVAPIVAMAAVLVGAAAIACVVAAVPARLAARAHPAQVLRTE